MARCDGATHLRAAFPYGAETELAPGRREIFAARAFSDRIEAGEDIHLLADHDREKPLASRAAGTLSLTDTDAALVLEARIDGGTSWSRDFLAAHASGLIRGLSPRFIIQLGGEKIENRGAGLLRAVTHAALFDLSAVTAQPTRKPRSRRRRGKAIRTGNPSGVWFKPPCATGGGRAIWPATKATHDRILRQSSCKAP